MNDKAKRKARQAELEHELIAAWKSDPAPWRDFYMFLEYEATSGDAYVWDRPAKELIELYEAE
jgi:hypothetical protein